MNKYGYKPNWGAIRAYLDGEKPLSKWSKAEIVNIIKTMIESGEASTDKELLPAIEKLPLPVMKKWLLRKSSCHVTGNAGRHTYFYVLDKASLESMTRERIEEILKYERTTASKVETKKCECSFLIWEGPRKNRIPKRVTETGQIKGDWFIRPDGSRKSIKGKGFRVVREIAS